MTTGPERLAAPPETRDDDPAVTVVMTTRIVGITADATLSTALRLMALGGVRHLPVFDHGRCCGILLESDVAKHLLGGDAAERSAQPVVDLVRPVSSVTVAARRSDVARSMQSAGIDAVLVTDHDRTVGIVTASDLIRSLAGTRETGS